MNISSNFRKYIVALTMLASVSLVSAQEVSVSKQINQIKRNTQYLYSEATMESESEAMKVAYDMLLEHVHEYVAENNPNVAVSVLLEDIKPKSESMNMMRGNMHRVFVYVKKSDIEGVVSQSTVDPNDRATVKGTESPRAMGDKQQSAPAAEQPQTAQQSAVVLNNAEKSVSVVADKPASQIAPVKHENEKAARQTESSPLETTVKSTTLQLTVWEKRAIESLLSCTDFAAVQAKLNPLLAEYKVKRYGTSDDCPEQGDVFWVIMNEGGGVIAVLCPDNGQLADYKTSQYVSLSQYKGNNAIWIQLSK